MADHADEGDYDGDIFIYRGGRAPQHVTHVRIDKSADEIEREAFRVCEHLVQVDAHDGLRKVGKWAFSYCKSLRRISLKSVVEIGFLAFEKCRNLESVEFGDMLETIGMYAFSYCSSLKHLKLPSIITIGRSAFWCCKRLIEIELSGRLERIEGRAFEDCGLRRIAVPLKRNLFTIDNDWQVYNQFNNCKQLTTVDLVGGIHKTVASLHIENWRSEMMTEINRINQVLPNTPDYEKTSVIRQWMASVLDKMDHYKAEHYIHVKEGITLLELALWKAKLAEKEMSAAEGRKNKVKVDAGIARKEKRITCGADIVIKNVFPFLQLD